ncbi:MAG: NAD(P)/FAD-dependent oxidoreductase [Oscillospiraceae bacterium]|nr:NAD(P)/FAD-dependent oxidoreductase [Oscillospiraceae bacterium]
MADVCVVGAGPAGISAALYALRGGFSVTVLDNGSGALRKAEKIENYYGFAEPICGDELAANGRAQAVRLGAELVTAEAVSLAPAEGGFVIGTAGGAELTSRAVVLAAGSPRKTPSIPGLVALEGHGVSYCAVCDAFFYRKKQAAVLGFGEYAKAEAAHLLPLAGSVTLLTNGEEPGADFPPEVTIVTARLAEFLGEKRLERVRFADGGTLPLDGVFVAYGTAGSADLARKIGALTQGSAIIADAHGQTNIPGLYAAGDCTGGTLQIAKAVYDGMNAGLSLIKYLR